jgi:hypothetical protein
MAVDRLTKHPLNVISSDIGARNLRKPGLTWIVTGEKVTLRVTFSQSQPIEGLVEGDFSLSLEMTYSWACIKAVSVAFIFYFLGQNENCWHYRGVFVFWGRVESLSHWITLKTLNGWFEVAFSQWTQLFQCFSGSTSRLGLKVAPKSERTHIIGCRVYRHFDIGWIAAFFEPLNHWIYWGHWKGQKT